MKCSVLVKPETVLVNQISVSVFSGEVHRVADFERARAEDICRYFFPAGRKCGPEWKIGDLSGVPGDSLGVGKRYWC